MSVILSQRVEPVSGTLRAMLSVAELFDLSGVPEPWRSLFDVEAPWDVLARLDAFAATIRDDRQGEIHPTAVLEGDVVVERGAAIGPHAYVQGPAWLMAGARVGHGAYLRGNVLLAPDAWVQHASEVKRSIILGGARAPHFNYIGDSVIGHRVNLGAGVKIANYKAFGDPVRVDGRATNLRKLGALVGDDVSVGCNAVLAPGTAVGPRSVVYHGAMVRGIVSADSVVKYKPELVITPRLEPG
jgi:UDP-N-acetylglucosamine diphosphorylase / glucose-1-phosphate thymidylyltransferase / UDP-N-acetylgalactosamine diphosphorylase / glucosamine-1-phosphate N-acetyltransferase / galactosamine-1-phosphate N-acetyltransferase